MFRSGHMVGYNSMECRCEINFKLKHTVLKVRMEQEINQHGKCQDIRNGAFCCGTRCPDAVRPETSAAILLYTIIIFNISFSKFPNNGVHYSPAHKIIELILAFRRQLKLRHVIKV